jgi:signal transduction histidine kinase
MRKAMKPKFAYLYISFIVSLAILVILSFLFYKRLNSHLKYTRQFNETNSVIFELKDLEEKMMELQNYSRGFLLVRDSSFLPVFLESRDSVYSSLTSLREAIEQDPDQLTRFQLMRTTVNTLMNIFNRNLGNAETADLDDTSVKVNVQRGKRLMETFRTEIRQLEQAERRKVAELEETKEFFEDYYPSYFNTISVWAGVITLVSFFFINREVRMRRKYQTELEKKLQELNRSNSELKQFAYIASHDLQEPLRKIRTFSDKLVYKHRDHIDEESAVVIKKIEASAQRMQELLQDMLNFTSLVNREDKMIKVDLNKIVTSLLKDFIEVIETKHAIITWDTLPTLNGSASQLTLLFRSLFDNSFKFAKPGESPVIKIGYSLVDGNIEGDPHLKGKPYHKIIMKDEGIGFNNEFAEKIFMIFQRLHTQQSGYRGKGIGLAIAQRIMTNHNGVIMARGMINDGATFIMYFPVE